MQDVTAEDKVGNHSSALRLQCIRLDLVQQNTFHAFRLAENILLNIIPLSSSISSMQLQFA